MYKESMGKEEGEGKTGRKAVVGGKHRVTAPTYVRCPIIYRQGSGKEGLGSSSKNG